MSLIQNALLGLRIIVQLLCSVKVRYVCTLVWDVESEYEILYNSYLYVLYELYEPYEMYDLYELYELYELYALYYFMYCIYCMIVREKNLLLTRWLFGRQSSTVQSHTCVLELRFRFKPEIELWNVCLLFT